ncbi:M20/M25/M40 family metallo-hydrolase [Desulfonema magnum]|uniref:Peptidase M20 domain-containing protein n=1 Tax=Desulfonema magnum TaxID=45655 RepID=A0A975BR71_9BACT|nr:M20/M25/M40 family metallo-hydrolase [Desulfonema magnum]QTA89898.1 Peptidase M20 domain-containing protein [Desulfonema magnum]
MNDYLDELPSFAKAIRRIGEIIITNIVLIGQIPSPTFQEKKRADFLLERMAEFQVDECATDSYGNPVGIIRGTSETKPPIFVVAHLDTFFNKDSDHSFAITENSITGPGILDNSAGVGVLASLPEIFRRLDIRFESDIVLSGVIQSIGKGNLAGIRHLLQTWSGPVRGAVCLESGELGRLNYYSDGMIRCEVECNISRDDGWEHKFKPNAILTLNEVINEILAMRLPQRPRARVIIGKISGGYKHGTIAYDAKLGFEIQSKSDEMVKVIFNEIQDIVNGYSHEYEVELKLRTISNQKAARLAYNHPLVKNAVAVMKKLSLKPVSEPSESELSVFLSRNIPAVTLGITHGDHFHQENATIKIEPMYKGITQVLGVLMAIDRGVCDE